MKTYKLNKTEKNGKFEYTVTDEHGNVVSKRSSKNEYAAWSKTPRGINYFVNNNIVINETVCQYTGLNAKKKKINLSEKIFEGDIFRGLNDKDIEEYYVVMWIEQRAAFYMVPADHYCVLKDNDLSNDDDFNWLFDDAMLYDFSSDCSLTKVGNVHDNKELLK